jgi:hypothetical protein
MVEHLADLHQTTGKGPFTAGGSVLELDQIARETAALDREEHCIDRKFWSLMSFGRKSLS